MKNPMIMTGECEALAKNGTAHFTLEDAVFPYSISIYSITKGLYPHAILLVVFPFSRVDISIGICISLRRVSCHPSHNHSSPCENPRFRKSLPY
jgi:hypothetical protein